MDAREAAAWERDYKQRRREQVLKDTVVNPRHRGEHVCTLPYGRVTGYRWMIEGKMIYIHPIIETWEAS